MKACPFCGDAMEATSQGASHPYVSRSNGEPVCFMNGAHIGKERLPDWDRRSILLKLVDDLPRFGYDDGTPVTLSLVNDTVAYLSRKEP